jgi:hypothetical protein
MIPQKVAQLELEDNRAWRKARQKERDEANGKIKRCLREDSEIR